MLIVLAVLTYQRSAVWASRWRCGRIALRSRRRKYARAFSSPMRTSNVQDCAEAAENYEIASRLAPPDYRLLVNWGIGAGLRGHYQEALDKLQQASTFGKRPRRSRLCIAQVYAQQHQTTRRSRPWTRRSRSTRVTT